MADAVHVVLALANLMEADGTLNAETAARVDLAVEMFERQSADRLMVIGWAYRPDSEIAIGDAMATYARARHGVDDAALLVNRYARDTSGDAILSRIQLGALFPKVRLTVATTDYHVPRVKTLFRVVYGPHHTVAVHGSESGRGAERASDEAASLAAFSETFAGIAPGDLRSFRDRLLSAHPFYNGTRFPEHPLPEEALEIDAARPQ